MQWSNKSRSLGSPDFVSKTTVTGMVRWPYSPTPKQLIFTVCSAVSGVVFIAVGLHLSYSNIDAQKAQAQEPPPSTNNINSSPASQGYSIPNTPRSSALASPTINLTHEYKCIQTESYSEIRRTFDEAYSVGQAVEIECEDISEEPQLLEQVLQPSQESVRETLLLIRTKQLSHLVATYFGHSEDTSRLCFHLYQSLRCARHLYAMVDNLLDGLPPEFGSDSFTLSQSQCDLANSVFHEFELRENPFVLPDSPKFDDVRRCVSDLRQKLDHHVKKSKRGLPFTRYCTKRPAMCMMAAGIGISITAVAIATNALFALVGSPICLAFYSSNLRRKGKGKVHPALLNAASKNSFVLHKDLDTIERLVTHLCTDVDNDKRLIHLGLERGDDSYFIQEILKQLQKNRTSFHQRVESLEEHLFLCFAAINRSRSRLLQDILQQNLDGQTLQ